jgi:uncharacterized membrane protein YhdT
MNSVRTSTKASGAATVGWAAAWIVAYFGCRMALRASDLPDWARVAIAVSPIIPFAVFLWLMICNLRGLDEMQRQVHLESLAIAFPLSMLLLMLIGLLQIALPDNSARYQLRDIWPMLPVLYFASLAWTWRRYS